MSFFGKKNILILALHRYKTAHFKGYFLGARAVLDIFFEFTPVMESGKKNEGAILHLLMQFNIKVLLIYQRVIYKIINSLITESVRHRMGLFSTGQMPYRVNLHGFKMMLVDNYNLLLLLILCLYLNSQNCLTIKKLIFRFFNYV